MHGKYSGVLIWPDSTVLLGWNLHCWMAQWLVHWGVVLGTPWKKKPIQTNCSGPSSFFSWCVVLWCCSQPEKSIMKQARYAMQLVARGLLFLSSLLMFIYLLQTLNSCNELSQYQVLQGNSGRKKVQLKWKSVKNENNEPSLTSMRQMALEISHFKVRNLSKMDVAIL